MLSARAQHGIRGCRRAVAALEFALVAPMLGLMMMGAFDLSKAVILWEQVQHTAHLVAVSASTMSQINPDRSTTLSAAVAQQSMSIVYAEMPWVRSAIETGTRSVTLTSVQFAPRSGCTPTATQNCYDAHVAFSVAYGGGAATGGSPFQQVTRACGTLTQIAPQAPLPLATSQLSVLRTLYVTDPDALIVADVHYQYKPFFYKFLTGPIDFWATNIFPARIGTASLPQSDQYTQYSGSGGTGNCFAWPPT